MMYNKAKNTIIDVIAKIEQIKDTENITSVHGDHYEKKEIILIDENNRKITLNLWNEKINEFKGKKEDIIAIKNAKIGEYNYTKNLTLINSSRMSINPGVPEATKIREECLERNKDIEELDEPMYTKIGKILNLENQTILNVIAVVENIGDTDTVFAKDGREFKKKKIQLIDNSDEASVIQNKKSQ
ncbi:replication protein A 70 kDa DNA-binding subunit B-like [Acyrthosiphon pisum]|uniref:Replication protein A OB domain-containing protein n=1 Tax=Acyrthosiphon pisum TaxID=7029 RepID=A0A8R2JXL0_ACYPI|nr:replication protein A 70 kDa DNA-binding subunit B-like [Acyrthosiphon pisum]